VGIGVGMALEIIASWRLTLTLSVRLAPGVALIVGGVVLIVWAVRSAGPVRLARPAQLVTTGAYRRRRNPMYVGWTLAYVGVALIVGSAWLLVLLPLVLVVIHVQTLAEERALERQLGELYAQYRARSRRHF
jgi:protein-S-isoprenylcysteine O-methyltransferase Ste14